jgi:hypothetical protein
MAARTDLKVVPAEQNLIKISRMVSGGRRRHSQFAVATYTQPSGFSVANCRHVIGCRSKPDSRQVALYAFKMPAIYEKGFVPYTYTAVGTNPLVEIFPGTRVGSEGFRAKFSKSSKLRQL